LKYTIKYKAKNTYEALVNKALWQFLIIPENNGTQDLEYSNFTNSLKVIPENSVNGYGFNTYRVHPKKEFKSIDFEAEFRLTKTVINPYDQVPFTDIKVDYEILDSLKFKTEHEPFLKSTPLTKLPEGENESFSFDLSKSPFENLNALNAWVYTNFDFKTDVTTVKTNLKEILSNKQGVCQDFTHLFCALARKNKIPTRYVSGYLHQGSGFLGDSQMHAWVESFIPGAGWIGFDPTNNILAAESHIKVAHGKDYTDCPPLKGIVYTSGSNETSYTVDVTSEKGMFQQQGQQSQQSGSQQQMQQQQQGPIN
tara:strand:- start:478 stop:1407 length:930 start_codon:yes stop_codon:yes gene_type:complete